MKTKRVFLLVCAFVLLFSCLVTSAGAAAPVPNSLYTRIDPSTGKTFDLKGKNVYIYDFWTGADWHDQDPETDQDVATWKYRKWLEKTYNCKIYQIQKGDWGSQINELTSYVQNPDKNLCLFIVPSNNLSQVISASLAADWKQSTSISLADSKWNAATTQMMTLAGGVYGVSTGKPQPRQCLYFNKRVLDELGVDWNTFYDLQKSGKWTWDKFTEILNQVQVDLDGDGVNDIWGLTGSSDDLYRIAVFSNGGSFFDVTSSGQLASTVKSAGSKEALSWAKKLWNQYAAPRPDNAGFDWYKDYWKTGRTAFYIYQIYGGFNQVSEMSDMADPWGAVAFPKGPKGKSYVTLTSENVSIIPCCYNKQQISQVSLIYDLWTCPAPDTKEEDRLAQYLGLTDERAIYETYALLQESGKWDQTELLGSINELLGVPLLWALTDGDLSELIESAKESWDAYLKAFNQIMARLVKEQKARTAESKGLKFDLDPSDKTAKVTGATKKNITSVTVPATVKAGGKTYKVTAVADQALKGYKKITKVSLGKNVKSIGKDAFNGCVKLKTVTGGSGLVLIGDGAFYGCSALASVTLESKVASIGDEAFCKCKNLKTLKIKTTKLKDAVIGKNAFKGIYKKAKVEVPSKKLKDYKALLQAKGLAKTASVKGK